MSRRLSARDQARKAAEAAAAVGRETMEQGAETERFQSAGRDQWVRIPYDRLIPDETQPRSHFEELEELADSIQALGGLEDPIRVYPEERGRWRIKDGERRYRALGILLERGNEQFRDVPVLLDRRPSGPEGGARLRVEQLVTSIHKSKLMPLETARTLLDIARAGEVDDTEMPAARVSELTGVKQRQAERYLQVGRGLRREELNRLLADYPHAPLEMLIELVKWLDAPTGRGLNPTVREEVIRKVGEEKPTAAALPRLLQASAVKKRPGRPAAAKFSYGKTRDGGFDVTIRIPPNRLGEPALREAEEKLSAALGEVRRLLAADPADADAALEKGSTSAL